MKRFWYEITYNSCYAINKTKLNQTKLVVTHSKMKLPSYNSLIYIQFIVCKHMLNSK